MDQILPFERWARRIWPIKAAANLVTITGSCARTCKYWMAGKREPSFSDVVLLLQSEHGCSFLQYVMAGANPDWWRDIRNDRELGALRKQLDEQKREIEQLELELGLD